MRTPQVLLPLALLALVLAPPLEAEAAPRLRGPIVGHVGPTTAYIWVYTGYASGAYVNYRPKDAPLSAAKRVDVKPNNGHKAVLTGLKPSTAYVYRVTYRGKSDDRHWRGRFRTPPPVGTPHAFRMVASSCMKSKVKFHKAWLKALAFDPDFQLLLGDNAYVDSTLPKDHWKYHLRMRGVWEFAWLARECPTYATWDDHDFAGNDSAGQTVRHRDRILDAFKELWPNPSYGLPKTPGTFFKLSRGDVDFFVLDVRYYRSPPKAPNNRRKRMLGNGQFAWLAREMKASKARFKVICSGSTIGMKDPDNWKHYSFALQRVYSLIRDNKIGGVLWLSGDLHDSVIADHPKAQTGFYDLVEVVTSGIANGAYFKYALLDFDTTLADPTVRIRIQDAYEKNHADRTVRLSELQMR